MRAPSPKPEQTPGSGRTRTPLPWTQPDIDVEVSERELRITGELKEREREGVLRRATRRSGHFEYRALLPTEVNSEQVSAQLADGILTVAVPKTQTAKPRHIEITT